MYALSPFIKYLLSILNDTHHFAAHNDLPFSEPCLEELLQSERRLVVEHVKHEFIHRFHEPVVVLGIQVETLLRYELRYLR